MFTQLLVNGLIAGAIYALVASGFSLIYSICKFVHFAHGAAIVLAAYILYSFFSLLGLSFWLSVILTVTLTAIFGFLMHLIYKRARKRKATNLILLVVSFALLILFESTVLLFWGADVKMIGLIETAKGVEMFRAIITPLQIFILVTASVLFILLFLLMKKTKIGKAMRAVAGNKDVAEIVGISSERIYKWAFIIGSAIAGIAGILIALEQNIAPTMGTHLMIKGFTGAIIGGIGNVPGAILGSLLLGFTENFGIWFLPSAYKSAIAFAILFIFLILRPQGILGRKNNT